MTFIFVVAMNTEARATHAVASTKSAAKSICHNYFLYNLESPLRLKIFLEKRNLDIQKLSVQRSSSSFKVYYNNKHLIEFNLFENYMGYVYPHTQPMSAEKKGIGLGLVSYLLLARDLYTNNRRLLSSDVTLSDSVVMLWQRLVYLGFAQDYGPYYQFLESSMESDFDWADIDAVLQKSYRPVSFFDRIYRKIFEF